MADNKRIKDGNPDATDANRDAITGTPGSHPVGTGIGAASAGAAGAAIGAVAGPAGSIVGAAIGTIVGAVAGGLAGKGIAEAVNPTAEDAYWRSNYKTRPYATNSTYEEMQPAYRYGWECRTKYSGRKWDDVEGDLRSGWDKMKDKTRLEWDHAKNATRDAFERGPISSNNPASVSAGSVTGTNTTRDEYDPGSDGADDIVV